MQRFGTKAGLLRAALLRAWDLLDEQTAAAAAAAGPGPEGVVDMLVAAVRLSTTRTTSPTSSGCCARTCATRCCASAVSAGWPCSARRWSAGWEPAAPDGIGELVVAHWQGTLTVWGFTRSTPLSEAVRTALTALLAHLRLCPNGTFEQ